MIVKQLITTSYAFSWDYKDSPNWHEIMDVIDEIKSEGRLYYYDIETRTDDHGLLLTNFPMEPRQADDFWSTMIGV